MEKVYRFGSLVRFSFAVLLRPVIHLALGNARLLGISSGWSVADGFSSLNLLEVLVLSSIIYVSIIRFGSL
jgi:hypothetical protein